VVALYYNCGGVECSEIPAFQDVLNFGLQARNGNAAAPTGTIFLGYVAVPAFYVETIGDCESMASTFGGPVYWTGVGECQVQLKNTFWPAMIEFLVYKSAPE